MRRAVAVLLQILAAAVGISAIGGLIGFLVVHFDHWGGASKGFGWGMVIAGGAIALVTGNSGSPSENFQRGRLYPRGLPGFNRPTRSVPMPESPLEIALGGLLAFAAGIAVFFLFGY